MVILTQGKLSTIYSYILLQSISNLPMSSLWLLLKTRRITPRFVWIILSFSFSSGATVDVAHLKKSRLLLKQSLATFPVELFPPSQDGKSIWYDVSFNSKFRILFIDI